MTSTCLPWSAVLPWRHPARRELQFGEWLRDDLLAGVFEPPMPDPDLAVLLTKVRQHSVALIGPPARELFDPVPEVDRLSAFDDALALWNGPPDWSGDERNVVLTLARIWYSVDTGRIAAKDVAADWVLVRLPAEHRPVLREARLSYLGENTTDLADQPDRVAAFIGYARQAVRARLTTRRQRPDQRETQGSTS